MSGVLGDPVFWIAGALFAVLLLALVWAGSRQPYLREIERLRDDLHKILAGGSARLTVNGG